MSNNLPRRQFIQLSALTAGGLAVGTSLEHAASAAQPAGNIADPAAKSADPPKSAAGSAPAAPTAAAALERLLEGNRRFTKGQLAHPGRSPADFAPLAAGQNPIAAIVGCADSRVPPEVIFDQGVGDLFVVRIAGNTIGEGAPLVKGSVEYAVAELRVPLVMVLGHSQCGALKAAIKHLADHDPLPGAIRDLVATLQPAVARAAGRPGDTLENTIRANVELTVERLKALPPILAAAVKAKTLMIVGATYDLRTGKVTTIT